MTSAFDDAVMNPAHHATKRSRLDSKFGGLSIPELSEKVMGLDREVSILKRKLPSSSSSGKFSHLLESEDAVGKACVELKRELEIQLNKPESEINSGDRHKVVKIHRDFVNVMKRFNDVSSELADLSYSSANEMRESFQSMHGGHDEEKGVQFATMDNTVSDLDEYLIEERLKEAEDIAKKTAEINALFTDVSNLVKKQGEDIKDIVDNADSSAARAGAGVEHLHKASQHQKATGKCLKFFVGFVVLLALIVTIYFVFFKGKKSPAK